MKKRTIILIVVIVAIVIALIFAFFPDSAGNGTANSESPAPNESVIQSAQDTETASASQEAQAGPYDALKHFSATDLEGKVVTQDIFSDYDFTMVNIWATFCGPCINEMPELGQLKKDYADKGVNVVGIVVDITDSNGNATAEGVVLAKDIVAQTGADYTHIIPSKDMSTLVTSISVVPTTVFVDSQGNVVADGYYGALDLENWTRVIDYLLENE